MPDRYPIRRNDAAGCLTAALIGALDHWHDGTEISREFVSELCGLLEDDETSRIDVIWGLIRAAEDSVFQVVHWCYSQIERKELTAAEIFCFLGRFGAEKDNNGQLVLTRPGDGPEFFSLL